MVIWTLGSGCAMPSGRTRRSPASRPEARAMLESHDEVCFVLTDESSQVVGFLSSQSSALSPQFSIPNPQSPIPNPQHFASGLRTQASSLPPYFTSASIQSR